MPAERQRLECVLHDMFLLTTLLLYSLKILYCSLLVSSCPIFDYTPPPHMLRSRAPRQLRQVKLLSTSVAYNQDTIKSKCE